MLLLAAPTRGRVSGYVGTDHVNPRAAIETLDLQATSQMGRLVQLRSIFSVSREITVIVALP
jgi:hypothetical protein